MQNKMFRFMTCKKLWKTNWIVLASIKGLA